MASVFNYIIPRAGLTLIEIGRIFETEWAQECAVEITQTYYAGRLDTRQRDAHVRAYKQWCKSQRQQQQRQKRAHDTALWRQEQASIKEQEEAWNALLKQRRQERRDQERFDQHQKEIEQQEETLLEVLNQFSSDEPVRQALFDTRSNQSLLLRGFNPWTLQHSRLVLSARERKCLVEALDRTESRTVIKVNIPKAVCQPALKERISEEVTLPRELPVVILEVTKPKEDLPKELKVTTRTGIAFDSKAIKPKEVKRVKISKETGDEQWVCKPIQTKKADIHPTCEKYAQYSKVVSMSKRKQEEFDFVTHGIHETISEPRIWAHGHVTSWGHPRSVSQTTWEHARTTVALAKAVLR